MNIKFENKNVILDFFQSKEKIYVSEDCVVMHPFSAGVTMLETTAFTYTDVFKFIGVNIHSIDACFDAVMKKIDREVINVKTVSSHEKNKVHLR